MRGTVRCVVVCMNGFGTQRQIAVATYVLRDKTGDRQGDRCTRVNLETGCGEVGSGLDMFLFLKGIRSLQLSLRC